MRLDISNYDLILTTEKDGVKLTVKNKEIARKLWKLITELHLPDDFYRKLIEEQKFMDPKLVEILICPVTAKRLRLSKDKKHY